MIFITYAKVIHKCILLIYEYLASLARYYTLTALIFVKAGFCPNVQLVLVFSTRLAMIAG